MMFFSFVLDARSGPGQASISGEAWLRLEQDKCREAGRSTKSQSAHFRQGVLGQVRKPLLAWDAGRNSHPHMVLGGTV